MDSMASNPGDGNSGDGNRRDKGGKEDLPLRGVYSF